MTFASSCRGGFRQVFAGFSLEQMATFVQLSSTCACSLLFQACLRVRDEGQSPLRRDTKKILLLSSTYYSFHFYCIVPCWKNKWKERKSSVSLTWLFFFCFWLCFVFFGVALVYEYYEFLDCEDEDDIGWTGATEMWFCTVFLLNRPSISVISTMRSIIHPSVANRTLLLHKVWISRYQ